MGGLKELMLFASKIGKAEYTPENIRVKLKSDPEYVPCLEHPSFHDLEQQIAESALTARRRQQQLLDRRKLRPDVKRKLKKNERDEQRRHGVEAGLKPIPSKPK